MKRRPTTRPANARRGLCEETPDFIWYTWRHLRNARAAIRWSHCKHGEHLPDRVEKVTINEESGRVTRRMIANPAKLRDRWLVLLHAGDCWLIASIHFKHTAAQRAFDALAKRNPRIV